MKLSQAMVETFATHIANQLPDSCTLVGIPRGGLAAAYLVASKRQVGQTILVRSADEPRWLPLPDQGTVLIDDLVATGSTLVQEAERLDQRIDAFAALVHKRIGDLPFQGQRLITGHSVPGDEWVEFPWESREQGGTPLDAVRRLIEYLGDDPTRDGLVGTPERVLRFYDELRAQREMDWNVTCFETTVDDLTIATGIPFASLCEHHMLPYEGTFAVGYLPEGEVLGLSKIPRAIQTLSAGLSIQEGLTAAVAEMVQKMTSTDDVAVISEAVHTCVTMRGPRSPGTRMVSSSMHGQFRKNQDLRNEFLAIARGAQK